MKRGSLQLADLDKHKKKFNSFSSTGEIHENCSVDGTSFHKINFKIFLLGPNIFIDSNAIFVWALKPNYSVQNSAIFNRLSSFFE